MADGGETEKKEKYFVKELLEERVVGDVEESIAAGGRVKFDVVVQTSTIEGAGNGLFANEDIPKGKCVGEYVGGLLGLPEVQKMPRSERDYLMRLGGSPVRFVDAKPYKQVMLRFVNDARSEEKNNLRWEKHPDRGLAFAFTTRSISKGEELFAPYGFWYWAGYDRKLAHGLGKKIRDAKMKA